MFVKQYTYRVHPEYAERCREIQRRAGEIYDEYVDSRTVVLRSEDNPWQWTEIQWYRDRETHDEAMERINAEPEISRLWREFETTLDRDDSKIHEAHFEQQSFRDGLTAE